MKRLTKKQAEEQNALYVRLESEAEIFAEAVEKANAAIANAFSEYTEALEKYNGELGAARDFRDEIVSAMDDYMSERSEKWHESEAGEAYNTWKETWESFELDEIEAPDAPTEIDDPTTNISPEDFNELPGEPEAG